MCFTNPEKMKNSADSSEGNYINPEFNLSSEKLLKVKKDFRIDEQMDDDENCEIVELDAVELLKEHVHFCEICGEGFKRDANLRMHMRAHGNQFKTLEALTKQPDKLIIESSALRRKVRFSCPFVGCNNKLHKKFRPLKSAICVKNHFRRSHCPKMYSSDRCNKKRFSVLTDLKSHLKHCGDSKWKCSCGTTFSRKDKLFGHIALFEGHMPAFTEETEKAITNGNGNSSKEVIIAIEENEEESGFENIFNGFQENFGGIVHDDDNGNEDCLRDIFESPVLGTGMDSWFIYNIV